MSIHLNNSPADSRKTHNAGTQQIMDGTHVIKIGGGEGIDPAPILREVADLVRDGVHIVIVHGTSHEATTLGERLGTPPEFISSPSGHTSRRTDRTTMDVFQMACRGAVNPRYVEALHGLGVRAIGLSGMDGPIWRGKRKTAIRAIDHDGRTRIIRDDLSGVVTEVDTGTIRFLLDAGMTPVLCPPALSADNLPINVDADRAAAATAAALEADQLFLLSNVPGLLEHPEKPDSLIRAVGAGDREPAREAAQGRMKNKVLAAEEAVDAGVPRVIIASAAAEHPLHNAHAGRGTVYTL